MKVFRSTEIGKGIEGIIVSLGFMAAALIPILMMDVFSKLFHIS